MNVVKLNPSIVRTPTMMNTNKPNKFNNLKNKFIKFEQKRFSRIKSSFNTTKNNFTEDINEIDQIMKDTFQSKNEDEEPVIDTYEIEKNNDAFFD